MPFTIQILTCNNAIYLKMAALTTHIDNLCLLWENYYYQN